jgi:hypothetical protein
VTEWVAAIAGRREVTDLSKMRSANSDDNHGFPQTFLFHYLLHVSALTYI